MKNGKAQRERRRFYARELTGELATPAVARRTGGQEAGHLGGVLSYLRIRRVYRSVLRAKMGLGEMRAEFERQRKARRTGRPNRTPRRIPLAPEAIPTQEKRSSMFSRIRRMFGRRGA